MSLYFNIVLLAFIGAGTWWLTGIDKTAGGESKSGHHLTRALRCVAMVFLTWAFLGCVESAGGYGSVPLLIIIPMCMALVLRSSVSELFTHGFLRLIDPAHYDDREFDPKKTQRYQDAIAHLIHNGRREDAIKLCEELRESGELDVVTIQNTLEYLGVKQDRAPVTKPLLEAGRLRQQGKFAEAEQLLKALLAKNPADDGAALMLMRLYAENLRQPGQAYKVLDALAAQPHVPAAHVEFARRSIAEWSQAKPPPLPKSALQLQNLSVDELLEQGSFGTAIDRLEEQVKAEPGNFDLQMKLAEVYAVHCKNLLKAEKIIQALERRPGFNPQKVAEAQSKIREWHANMS